MVGKFSFVAIPLFRADVVTLGLVYNIMTKIIPPIILAVVFLIWKILSCTVVIQEKEGSRE